jgi:hypothetical protein
MSKISVKKPVILLFTLLISFPAAYPQLDNVDFLKIGPADGAKFIKAYIEPWANAFGSGLSGGWYNTAKPHKKLGFDITTSINVGIVPVSAEKFELSSIGLSSSVTGTGLTPTVAGPKTGGQPMTYKSGSTELASFDAPPGTAWRYIPAPVVQAGLGLPFGTEIKVRYIPEIKIQGGNLSLWGVGLMHSVMQYIPGNKLLPFDVSLFGGYTSLQADAPLELEPDPDPAVKKNYTSPYNATTSFKDQKLNLSISALNISAIASLNLPVITFYGGLGYCRTNTEIKFYGNYPTPTLVTPTPPATPYVEYNNTGVKKGSDFPEIKISNFSGLRANIGFRIKLAVITIHADYTKALYNVLSAGLGISIR